MTRRQPASYTSSLSLNMGVCMLGNVFFMKDRQRWGVSWPKPKGQRGSYNIYRYKGEFMYHEKIARKCLALIQARYEQAQDGVCVFRIEEFLSSGWTDVCEYYETWMKEVIEPKRKPATIKGYWSYYRTWIKPFFEEHKIMLHEIRLDTLTSLLNSIKLSGKGKQNVMMTLHSMMDYAWRSERIPEMPPFPKRSDYNIVQPQIKWLTEDRQMAIIGAIPDNHRPIFLWLKYHLRRPAEACALRAEDYDRINGVFFIRRSISARKIVSSTKTGAEHIIPCHPDFRTIADSISTNGVGHFFTNELARRKSKRYTNESLNNIWKAACKMAGENIDLYSGLKHSSCSQYINEKGLSISDVQELTDHARLDSVRRYAHVSLARKRELMTRGTVLHFKRTSNGESDSES